MNTCSTTARNDGAASRPSASRTPATSAATSAGSSSNAKSTSGSIDGSSEANRTEPARPRGRINAGINNPNPSAFGPRWFIGKNCIAPRCSTEPTARLPGRSASPSRSCRVNGADAWSWRPRPTLGVSTCERSRIVGEWIAPAASTTRSAGTTSPSARRTPMARRPSNTIRSTSESVRTSRLPRSSAGHSDTSAAVTRRPLRRVSRARRASGAAASSARSITPSSAGSTSSSGMPTASQAASVSCHPHER
jgi:hypothetical protein